jgi:hypothetical protein
VIISGRFRSDWKMVSSDAQAACEFVRSKPLSDRAYSRFSGCGYAADNPKAVLFAAVLSTRSQATAVPAPPLASLSAGADRPAPDIPRILDSPAGFPESGRGINERGRQLMAVSIRNFRQH